MLPAIGKLGLHSSDPGAWRYANCLTEFKPALADNVFRLT
jgi:hypothetical protein